MRLTPRGERVVLAAGAAAAVALLLGSIHLAALVAAHL